ncbi:hypothetical protein [uncultured Campylobacter sp.]|uniref:hypothetical protein n=1 Tax=uncultured Campylobacter sp. TaxID=218934 RepID=UPI003211BCFC
MPSSNLSLAPSLKCKTAGKFDLNGINSALGAGYLGRKKPPFCSLFCVAIENKKQKLRSPS